MEKERARSQRAQVGCLCQSAGCCCSWPSAKKAAKAAEREAKQAARGVSAKPTWGESKKDKKEKAKIEGVSVTEWVNPTPEGHKKGELTAMRVLSWRSDVSGDMPVTGYDPIQVEAAHYAWWKSQGYFKPKYQEDGKPLPRGCFSISLPPPNVTGSLHCGHALTIALEDAMVRW
jgi:valyl-tRNA synthetase